MKKICLSITIALLTYYANAQTNTFPSSGNVGIGTTTPQEPLSIVATTPSSLGLYRSIAGGNPNLGAAVGQINFGAFNATSSTELPGAVIMGMTTENWVPGSSQGSAIVFRTTVNTTAALTEAMRIDNTGYLGIGTTTPASKLQVMGSFIASGIRSNLDPNGGLSTLPNNLANTGQMLIGWNRLAGNGETDFIANQGPGSMGGFAFFNHDNSNNETLGMWIQGSGNVLIGEKTQVNTAYKLDVNGNVRANQVVVNTTGADFVFEPAYHLFPLADLKKYIDQNHHLPEIASAKEMQTDGLNVGENQIKLLQKIEELTLYAITSDKQINDEKAVIARQQELLNQQQALLLQLQDLLKTQQKEIDQLIEKH